ncbi:hypothetical protein OG216_46650 (plasmid) [Streptomycetaceae bacterium NBC_01309]
MAYIADLSPYTYQDDEHVDVDGGVVVFVPRYPRIAVGWLAAGREISRGAVPSGFVEALIRIKKARRVNPMRGFHSCEFCPAPDPFDGWPETVYGGASLSLGNAEIRVPVPQAPRRMFAAPNLVIHYVIGHDYAPPQEFIDAVMADDGSWAELRVGPWFPAGAEILEHSGRTGVLTADGVKRLRSR